MTVKHQLEIGCVYIVYNKISEQEVKLHTNIFQQQLSQMFGKELDTNIEGQQQASEYDQQTELSLQQTNNGQDCLMEANKVLLQNQLEIERQYHPQRNRDKLQEKTQKTCIFPSVNSKKNQGKIVAKDKIVNTRLPEVSHREVNAEVIDNRKKDTKKNPFGHFKQQQLNEDGNNQSIHVQRVLQKAGNRSQESSLQKSNVAEMYQKQQEASSLPQDQCNKVEVVEHPLQQAIQTIEKKQDKMIQTSPISEQNSLVALPPKITETQPQQITRFNPETKSQSILLQDIDQTSAFQSLPYYENKKLALTEPITSLVSNCKFRIQNIKYCIGFGIGIKEIIEKHGYDYQSEGSSELMHGLYIVTSQGYSWSNSEKDQDDVFRQGFNYLYNGLVVDVQLVGEQLSFKWKKGQFRMTVPSRMRQKYTLCYCVYLHEKSDAISLSK